MYLKRTLIAFILAASLLTSAAPIAFGQSAGDWSMVQSLTPDEQIVITLKSGKEAKGKLLDANGSEVTIMRKSKRESFAKDTIAQIHHVKSKAQKGKFALIGAGVGAGAGFGIGQSKNGPNVEDGEIYPAVGTLLGTGIGAVTGFFIGQMRRNRVLVYQAR